MFFFFEKVRFDIFWILENMSGNLKDFIKFKSQQSKSHNSVRAKSLYLNNILRTTFLKCYKNKGITFWTFKKSV